MDRFTYFTMLNRVEDQVYKALKEIFSHEEFKGRIELGKFSLKTAIEVQNLIAQGYEENPLTGNWAKK